MAENWCYWEPTVFRRRDLASVARPHDERGEPVRAYWLAWPPFISAHTLREVTSLRFKTAVDAMEFIDARWPIQDR